MTVSYNTVGAVSQGAGSCTPAFAATVALAEAAVLFSSWGNPEMIPPDDPAGFTLLGHQTGGAGSWGVDTGPRGESAWYKITDGTEDGTTVTLTNNGSATGNTKLISGQIVQCTKTLAEWFITAVMTSDNTDDTSFSIAPSTDPGPAVVGDLVLAGGVWRPDTVAPASPTINYPGIGASTTSQIQSIANTNGHDMRFMLYRRPVSSGGPSSGAPSFTQAPASAVSGAGIIVLLHDGAAITPPSKLPGWGIAV